jgi:hypothetical protein
MATSEPTHHHQLYDAYCRVESAMVGQDHTSSFPAYTLFVYYLVSNSSLITDLVRKTVINSSRSTPTMASQRISPSV